MDALRPLPAPAMAERGCLQHALQRCPHSHYKAQGAGAVLQGTSACTSPGSLWRPMSWPRADLHQCFTSRQGRPPHCCGAHPQDVPSQMCRPLPGRAVSDMGPLCSGHPTHTTPVTHHSSAADPTVAQRQDSPLTHYWLAPTGSTCVHTEQQEHAKEPQARHLGDTLGSLHIGTLPSGRACGPHVPRGTHADRPTPEAGVQLPVAHAGAKGHEAVRDPLPHSKISIRCLHPASGSSATTSQAPASASHLPGPLTETEATEQGGFIGIP